MNTLAPTPSEPRSKPTLPSRIGHFARAHAMTVSLLVLGTTAGAVGGALLPIEAAPATRMLGGAIAGFYFALFPLGERLFD